MFPVSYAGKPDPSGPFRPIAIQIQGNHVPSDRVITPSAEAVTQASETEQAGPPVTGEKSTAPSGVPVFQEACGPPV
jgi:hypothetical protein